MSLQSSASAAFQRRQYQDQYTHFQVERLEDLLDASAVDLGISNVPSQFHRFALEYIGKGIEQPPAHIQPNELGEIKQRYSDLLGRFKRGEDLTTSSARSHFSANTRVLPPPS